MKRTICLAFVLAMAFAATTQARPNVVDPMRYARYITVDQAVAAVGDSVPGTIPGRSGIFVASDLSGNVTPIGTAKKFYGKKRWKRFRVDICGYVSIHPLYNPSQVVDQAVSARFVLYGGIEIGDGYKGSDFPTFAKAYDCPS